MRLHICRSRVELPPFFHILFVHHKIIFIPFLIFSLVYSVCCLSVRFLSMMIPRYLYSFLYGYPLISPLSDSAVLPLYPCIRTPDFFLLIIILLFEAHYSTVSIAYFNSLFLNPITARSSAYANAMNPLLLSTFIRSLNIMINSVGLKTPPYMTPLLIGTCSFPILIYVYL